MQNQLINHATICHTKMPRIPIHQLLWAPTEASWLHVGILVQGRDPHIILFYIPIILFSNSFFDFPLFFEYFPIILIILHDLGTYAALRAWLETRLTSNLPYTTESTRVGKSWRTKTIEQVDWRQSQTLLTRCSWRVDVDDAIITISGHCTKLDYSIRPTWGSRDLIYRPIILA